MMTPVRHYHGDTLHSHKGGGYPHDHGAFGRGGYVWEGMLDVLDGLGKVLAAIVIIAALFIAFHVVPAWLSRGNPPLACQIVGGHWSFWDGWQCG